MTTTNAAPKRSIALIFGGRSGEHEVSLLSARSVLTVLERGDYNVIQIGITHTGVWLTGEHALTAFEQGKTEALLPARLQPDPTLSGLYIGESKNPLKVDVYFPILHGTYGEDGSIQGLFELADVAYVGAGVIGSAAGMEKGVFKDVMIANHIPVVESVIVLRSEIEKNIDEIIRRAEGISAYPLFTKPANLGSSVGITKCRSRADLLEGLLEAAQYDRRILIERGVNNPREIEIAVLGNDSPQASLPGEIVPEADFYSYEAKYLLGKAGLRIPAQLSPAQADQIKTMAINAYKAVDCCGMARVDFLLDPQSAEIYLNEINTIPGFTQISMYPKLWDASGLPYHKLVEKLIDLALERQAERKRTVHQLKRRNT